MKPSGRGVYLVSLLLLLTVMVPLVTSSSWSTDVIMEEEIHEEHIISDITIFPGYNPTVSRMMGEVEESYLYDLIDTLENFEDHNGVPTRVTGSLGFEEAALWSYNKFRSYGLNTFMQNFTSGGHDSTNVIAELPGTDPDLVPETLIIGGHLDSINNRGTSDPAPGADDNGSGTALTLEAARIMSRYSFERTIRFALWGAEEQGLHGSRYYVANIDTEEEQVMCKLNYDMVGYADGELAIDLHGDTQSNWVLDYMKNVSDTYGNEIEFTYIYDSTEWRSDHSAFWDGGYNATLAIESVFSPYYHSADDTLDKLSMPQIVNMTKHAVATLAHLAGPMEKDTFEIDLTSDSGSDGWNFVSFNLIPTDSSLHAILDDPENGISGNYDRVTYYDSSMDRWHSYVPGRAKHFNNLDTWDPSMGLWIRMMEDSTLTIEGIEPYITNITLEPGWNMVGLPSSTTGNHALPSEIIAIGYFDPAEADNIAYEHNVSDFVFTPGKGYWLLNGASHVVRWSVQY